MKNTPSGKLGRRRRGRPNGECVVFPIPPEPLTSPTRPAPDALSA